MEEPPHIGQFKFRDQTKDLILSIRALPTPPWTWCLAIICLMATSTLSFSWSGVSSSVTVMASPTKVVSLTNEMEIDFYFTEMPVTQ